jgi:hypothetical protein
MVLERVVPILNQPLADTAGRVEAQLFFTSRRRYFSAVRRVATT